jgi:hypothetical protein
MLMVKTVEAVRGIEVMATDTNTARFNQFYTGEWYTYDDGSSNLTLRMTLKITNVDYSGWSTTDGSFGYWLGVGFGQSQMSGSDIVMCVYRFRGQSTADSRFYCYDRFANQRSMPIDDARADTTDIETLVSFNERTKKASLTAIFERPLHSDGI